MKSAAEFFRLAHGKKVIRFIEGRPCLDTWEQDKERIKASWMAQGASPSEITEDASGNLKCRSSFVLVPKQMKEEVGAFEVRSGDYIFTPDRTGTKVYGEKKGAKVIDGFLVKDLDVIGKMKYKILP